MLYKYTLLTILVNHVSSEKFSKPKKRQVQELCSTMIPPSNLPPKDSSCWKYFVPPEDGILDDSSPKPRTGCDYEPCEKAVCECDDYCCNVAWDLSCRGSEDDSENNFVNGCTAKKLCCEPMGWLNNEYSAEYEWEACSNDDPNCCKTMKPSSYLPPDDSTCWNWWEPPADGILAGSGKGEPPKGCDYTPCERAVCDCDDYCCNVAWDLSCRGYDVDEADDVNYFVSGCAARILCCEPKSEIRPMPGVENGLDLESLRINKNIPTISVQLYPDDKVTTFFLTHSNGDGDWYGEKDKDSFIVVETFDAYGNRMVHGTMVQSGMIYQIYRDSYGNPVVVKNDNMDFPDGDYEVIPLQAESNEEMVIGDVLLEDGSGTTVIDVMTVWTPRAECEESGLSPGCTLTEMTDQNMRNKVALAVQQANTAFDMSNVGVKLCLVAADRIDFIEPPSMQAALTAITDSVAEVKTLREQVGADIVTAIIGDIEPNSCGIAWVGPIKDKMVAIAARRCATSTYTWAHEVGHTLGCKHDRGTMNACSASGYDYGWRDPDSNFRTMMAYRCSSGQCDMNSGEQCDKILRFSSATLTYNGLPLGNAANDCARKINSIREQVAAFYPSKSNTCSSLVAAPPIAPISQVPPPVSPPVSAPISPPVSQPVIQLTFPPVTPPVLPPVSQPVTQLTFPPVSPPVTQPVLPPVSQSVTQLTFPPVSPPVTQLTFAPVTAPFPPPVTSPIIIPVVQPVPPPVTPPVQVETNNIGITVKFTEIAGATSINLFSSETSSGKGGKGKDTKQYSIEVVKQSKTLNDGMAKSKGGKEGVKQAKTKSSEEKAKSKGGKRRF